MSRLVRAAEWDGAFPGAMTEFMARARSRGGRGDAGAIRDANDIACSGGLRVVDELEYRVAVPRGQSTHDVRSSACAIDIYIDRCNVLGSLGRNAKLRKLIMVISHIRVAMRDG
ncbi:hypothetical protein [Burkholderia mayonis]|uniref:hypothetical protein n=1 Tax=Burkholderia mayonis TaxID=1385591 RepID=UPI001396C0D4|nr:hypothetical protein [Burkholderia mayonis]